MKIQLLALLLAFFLFINVFSQNEKCEGKTDVVFIIDDSGSIDDNEWKVFMEACIDIVNGLENIADDGVKVSIIRFGSKAETDVQLSGDKTAVLAHFNWLLEGCYDGGYNPCDNRWRQATWTSHGMEQGYQELVARGRDEVMTIVFLFTDGQPWYNSQTNKNTNCCTFSDYDNPCDRSSNTCSQAVSEYHAGKFETDFNAWVVPIMIGNLGSFMTTMMQNTATYDCLYFGISDFQSEYFKPLVEVFKTITCLDVYSLEPSYVCSITGNEEIQVNGVGFVSEIEKGDWCNSCTETCTGLTMKCKTKGLISGEEQIVDAQNVQSTSLTCGVDLDISDDLQQYLVSVSLDGSSFTTSNTTFETVNCTQGYEEPLEPLACNCNGLSDIVFVLDSSYSVDDTEFEQLKDFMEEVLMNLCIGNDTIRVSIVQFTTTENDGYAKVEFDLTGDRNHVIRSARNLGRFAKGGTPLHAGLKEAYQQIIDHSRSDAYKFVVVVTDGVSDSCRGINVDEGCVDQSIEENKCTDRYDSCSDGGTTNKTCYWDIMAEDNYQLTCCNCDEDWLTKIENTGAFVYGIAVGDPTNPEDDLDIQYVKERISTKESYYAHANDFSAISSIIDKIVDSTCIDVYYTDPGALCFGDDIEINIIGHGFSEGIETTVRFYHVHDSGYVDYTARYINSKKLGLTVTMNEVNSPHFKKPSTYSYQVSVGGKFWSETQEFQYDYTAASCQTQIEIVPIVATTTLVILGFLLVLAILLLISLFMCGMKKKPVVAKAVELQEEELEEPAPLPEVLPEPEPEPEPFLPPPKVKRSMYYVGGKAMSVDWGEKGMTWDSPFRGNNMGMGDNYGHTKKNKLYEEIQRRKKERLRRQNAAKNAGSKPPVNRGKKPPTVNRSRKPPTVNRAKKPARPARPRV